MEIRKLKPFLLEKIWGGNQLKDFGFEIERNQKIGEAWIISAHPKGMTYFVNGSFKGQSLKDVFLKHPNLFNNYPGEFPLLTKIITPNDFLPVHVHPNEEKAKKDNALGKPESWLVLAAPKNAYLIYGHHAQSKEELKSKIENQEWEKLLKKVPINVGDFVYVEAGKIHTITPGVIVYEVQRSSDLGYRIYDYDRLDQNGNHRQLDLEKAIDCSLIPDSNGLIIKNAQQQVFSSQYFSIYLWDGAKEKTFKVNEEPYWWQLTIISGAGTINGQKFKLGESAISLGPVEPLQATGNLKIVVSWIKKVND